jgi:hypothetical protein
MDGVALLLAAEVLALKVSARGDQLVVRGPTRLKPLADQILARKPEVMELLRSGSWRLPVVKYAHEPALPGPPKKCYGCGHVRWFTTLANNGRAWACGACHPPILPPENIIWWEGNDNLLQHPPLTSPHVGTRVVRTGETG